MRCITRDPEFNLDTLEGDRLRAYYATWHSLNVIYRGVVPQLITMSDYWRANIRGKSPDI